MPCYHPLQGWRKQGGGLTFNLRDGFVDRPVTVSCGQCIGCRLERSRQWAVRCMHEASLHTDNCFVTLTYDDDGLSHLPRCVDPETGEIGAGPFHSLNKRDIQLFFKRLRKRTGVKIRYFNVVSMVLKVRLSVRIIMLFCLVLILRINIFMVGIVVLELIIIVLLCLRNYGLTVCLL